jgi:hypothetical protein
MATPAAPEPTRAPNSSERRDVRAEERRVRQHARPPWSWQGATALTLALTVVVSMTALITGVILYVQNAPLPENIGALITATLSALIGAVATFLGRVGTNQPNEDRKQPQSPPVTPPPAEEKPDA